MAAPTYQEIKDSLRRLYLTDPRPWLVGFSGGKDSTMLASLIVETVADVTDDQRKKPIAILCTDILNFLIKKLSQQLAVKNDIQPLKMVLFVDEAHLLLPKENKAGLLSSLARQGRSWGFPVWMPSPRPSPIRWERVSAGRVRGILDPSCASSRLFVANPCDPCNPWFASSARQ